MLTSDMCTFIAMDAFPKFAFHSLLEIYSIRHFILNFNSADKKSDILLSILKYSGNSELIKWTP